MNLHGADISLCDFLVDGKVEHPKWEDRIFSEEEIFPAFLNDEILNRVLNKMYKTEIVKNICFPTRPQDLMEDAVWTAHVLERTKVLVKSNAGKYNYRQVKNSLSHKRIGNEELIGSFFNRLEKLKTCMKHVNDKRSIHKLSQDTRELIESVIIYGSGLKGQVLYDECRNFIAQHERMLEDNYEFNVIVKSKLIGEAKRRLLFNIKTNPRTWMRCVKAKLKSREE